MIFLNSCHDTRLLFHTCFMKKKNDNIIKCLVHYIHSLYKFAEHFLSSRIPRVVDIYEVAIYKKKSLFIYFVIIIVF